MKSESYPVVFGEQHIPENTEKSSNCTPFLPQACSCTYIISFEHVKSDDLHLAKNQL